MTLLNLAEAKKAAGAKKDVQYVYNGPGSWPVPADTTTGANVVAGPKVREAAREVRYDKPAEKPAKNPLDAPYTVPMFAPMDKDKGLGPKDKYGGWDAGRPMHIANIDTRGHIMGVWMGFGYKGVNDSDSYVGIYNSYFWAAASFILMAATYFVHPWVAAVFAFMWGHFWSEYLIGTAWGIQWFKGKSLVHAT